jgi:hypothetical protein
MPRQFNGLRANFPKIRNREFSTAFQGKPAAIQGMGCELQIAVACVHSEVRFSSIGRHCAARAGGPLSAMCGRLRVGKEGLAHARGVSQADSRHPQPKHAKGHCDAVVAVGLDLCPAQGARIDPERARSRSLCLSAKSELREKMGCHACSSMRWRNFWSTCIPLAGAGFTVMRLPLSRRSQ